jgi:ferredoxin-type protein NapH
MRRFKKYRYLIARRAVQISLLLLFFGANAFGWKILRGNYSSGILFDTIPLSDPYAVLQILATGFIAAFDVLIGAVIILILYGVFIGRMFCSWICPMNIVADTAILGSKKLGSKNILNFCRKTRYGILVLGLILSAFLATPAFEAISPVSMLHRGVIFSMGGGWAIIAALFLFDLAVTRYGWCGHLCPLGAFYSLIGKFAVIKIKHTAENCTNCGKCFEVCHEEQVLDIINIKTGFIKSPECTNCARCVEACNDNALKISLRIPFNQL